MTSLMRVTTERIRLFGMNSDNVATSVAGSGHAQARGQDSRRDRAFVAALLLGSAILVIADRLLPWPVGHGFLLLLGLGLLAWAGAAHHVGPLVPGCLMIGLGVGVLLVAGPLAGSSPGVIGGTVVCGLAGGWALLAVLAGPFARSPQNWAWIPGLICAVTGVAMLVDIDGVMVLAQLWWLTPATLVAIAAWLLLSRRRSR